VRIEGAGEVSECGGLADAGLPGQEPHPGALEQPLEAFLELS
jgi:hypothetical protein